MRVIKTMLAAMLLVAGIETAEAQTTYKLAVTDVEGLERLQTDWGPFRSALQTATGLSFEFFPVNSRTAAAEALKAERVDFVITGPAEYVVIHKLSSAAPVIGLGRPDYFCAIIVMADSGYVRPADLKGEKIALDDIGSTSGHLCPSQLLADYGVDPSKDVEVTHTSRNIAHEALKRGDVAAIGQNYNSWVSRARDSDKSMPPGAFRVIARSGDLPNDVLMAGAHVDPAAVDKVKTALLEDQTAIVAAILKSGGENEKYRGMALYPVEDRNYDQVRAMYATIGYPQFSDFVGD